MSRNKKLWYGLLIGFMLSSCLSCFIFFPDDPKEPVDPTDPDTIPQLTLNVAWQIDNAFPDLRFMSLQDTYLMIPHFKQGGLILADVRTGQELWRIENLFIPMSSAVMHNDTIYILGEFADSDTTYLILISEAGVYKGRMSIEAERMSARWLFLFGDYLFWTNNVLVKADLSKEFVLLEGSTDTYDPEYNLTFYVPKMPDPERPHFRAMGDTVLKLGEDIIFTYRDPYSSITWKEPTRVVRLNAHSLAEVWNYSTRKARLFYQLDLALYKNKILLNGGMGVELIDSENPIGKDPYWVFDDIDHNHMGYPIIVGDSIYTASYVRGAAVRAYSMEDGSLLWSLPNQSGADQNPQWYNGVLYVSQPQGVLAVDTATGSWIGRDDNHPGYSEQVNGTLVYENLFIHFTDQIPGTGGRVEALYMDVQPK
ncbi:outer membrane protein assembly factor BamB family protein [Spirochaeta lutea]|uniref:outer membrane protein assembly factor BamB family protein n=1 Tax=Spirochaeta lutea TaxID=1480694 RepID=UPI000A5191F1|nr:PQQ-binding-like beta-propeller repeat protein [Spirochaeta lutea]